MREKTHKGDEKMRINVNNHTEAIEAVTNISKKNPGKYVAYKAIFGETFVSIKSRLGVFAPSDYDNGYAINGKFKPFTNAQRIADQNATPCMH